MSMAWWLRVLLLTLCKGGEGYRTSLPVRNLQRLRTPRHRMQLVVPGKTADTMTFLKNDIDLDIALDRALGECSLVCTGQCPRFNISCNVQRLI